MCGLPGNSGRVAEERGCLGKLWSASLLRVPARRYVIRTAVEHETYLSLTPDDVTEAVRRVTGQQRPGRFAEEGVRFDIDWGSCTVTGSPSELRLRYDGASTSRLADRFTEDLVRALEDVTGEAHDWERQVITEE